MYTIATQALEIKMYHAAVEFFKLLIDTLRKEKFDKSIEYALLWHFNLTSSDAQALLTSAVKRHNAVFEKYGQFDYQQECNYRVLNDNESFPTISRKASETLPIIVGRQKCNSYASKMKGISSERQYKDTIGKIFNVAGDHQIKTLCTGHQIRVQKDKVFSLRDNFSSVIKSINIMHILAI